VSSFSCSLRAYRTNFLWFLAGGLFTSFVIEPVADSVKGWLTPKPAVVVHVSEIRPLSAARSFSELRNFHVMFGTARCGAELVVADLGPLNKRMGLSWLPTLVCRNCVEYSIAVANDGEATADAIQIRFSAHDALQIREADPRVTQVSCGGLGRDKGCFVRAESVGVGDILALTVVGNGLEGITDSRCTVNEIGSCEVNRRRFWVQHFASAPDHVEMDLGLQTPSGTKRVAIRELPRFSCRDVGTLYSLDFDTGKWTVFKENAEFDTRVMRCRDTPQGPSCVF
jgi:hypothetical protein